MVWREMGYIKRELIKEEEVTQRRLDWEYHIGLKDDGIRKSSDGLGRDIIDAICSPT